jgi:hypothetical protein
MSAGPTAKRRRLFGFSGLVGMTMLAGQCAPQCAPPPPPSPPPAVAPASARFVEHFETPASVNRFTRAVHHRNLALGAKSQHDFDETWPGDHNLACEGPTTQRVVHPSRDGKDPEAFWWCAPGNDRTKGHFMTSMGNIDGYSIVAFSPNQVMKNFRSVCWSVNLTDLLARKWWEVVIVPEAAFRANGGSLAYSHPVFLQPTVHALPAGAIDFVYFNGQVSLYVGQQERADESGGGFRTNDKARRYRHCLVDNGNGTITATQERNSGTARWTFPGSFPAEARVVFTDQSYNPTKDGVPQGFTWHWDAIEVT